jgi:hypothetical protein
MVIVLLILSAFILALGKAIADIVSNEPHWSKSIFSKKPIDSFFGCKDFTWKRKYKTNKIWNYLFTTILVFTTDIWHFANFISKVGLYLSLGAILMLNNDIMTNLYLVILHLIVNNVAFHLLYTYLLRK